MLAILLTAQMLSVFAKEISKSQSAPVIKINKLTSVFYASGLLLIMNFEITLSK